MNAVITGLFITIVGGLAVAAYIERCDFGYCETNLVVSTDTVQWFELSDSWDVELVLENVGAHPATNCAVATQQGNVQFSVAESRTWRREVLLSGTTAQGRVASERSPYVRVAIQCDNFGYDRVIDVGNQDI